MKADSKQELEERISAIVVEYTPMAHQDYNRGLLPDEDGYDLDKIIAIDQGEEGRQLLHEEIKDLINQQVRAALEEVDKSVNLLAHLFVHYARQGVSEP